MQSSSNPLGVEEPGAFLVDGSDLGSHRSALGSENDHNAAKKGQTTNYPDVAHGVLVSSRAGSL
jgi:hypothetical protein